MPPRRSRARAGAPEAPRLPSELDEVVLDPDEQGEVTDARIVEVVGDDLDDVSLVRCLLEGVRLTAVSARRLRLTDVVLCDCELSGIDLQEARLRRVRIERCRAGAMEAGALQASDVAVVDTKLTEAGLRMTGWERAEFEGVELRSADVMGGSLHDVTFSGCDLSRAVLSKVSMEGVRISGTRLDEVVGARSLSGATIDHPQLVPVALALFADLGIGLDDEHPSSGTADPGL